MLDRHLAHVHVRQHEIAQPIAAGARQPIKRKAHRPLVRIQTVAHAAERGRIVARADQILIDTIALVLGQHDKQLARHPLRRALGHQHVLRPTAAAEIEGGRLGGADTRTTGVQVAERSLEGNGDGRFVRAARNDVLAGIHWFAKRE